MFFYLANIIIDRAFNVWALVQETTGSIPCLPCAPWVNWLARSQLKCPSGVFVLGARGMHIFQSQTFFA